MMSLKPKHSLLLSGVLVIVCFAFLYKPLKSYVWAQRFEAHLSKINSHRESGKAQKAAELISLAWQFSDKSLDQLRALFFAAVPLDTLNAQKIGIALVASPDVKHEDVLGIIKAFLTDRKLPQTKTFLDLASDEVKNSDEYKFLQAQYFVLSNQNKRALPLLLSLVERDVGNLEYQSILMVSLVRERENPFAQKQAADLIRRALKNEELDVYLPAYRAIALLNKPEKFFRSEELFQWLSEKDEFTQGDTLFAYDIKLLEEGVEGRDMVLKAIGQRFSLESDVMTRWLLKHGVVLNESDEESMVGYLAKVQKAIDESRYSDAKAILEIPDERVGSSTIEVLKAALWEKEGASTKALFHGNRALAACAHVGQYEPFRKCLTILEHLEIDGLAQKFAEAIIELPVDRLPAIEELLYLDYYLKHDPIKLKELYERFYAARPWEVFVAYRYSLLLVVADEGLQYARKILFPYKEGNPESLAIRSVYAMTDLALGLPEAALESLPYEHSSWGKAATNDDRYILAVVLHKNGKDAEANAVLETLNVKKVTPFLYIYFRGNYPLLGSIESN